MEITENEVKQACAAFATLCKMLDENGWRYERNDEELVIRCGAQGDDLPMPLRMSIDVGRQLVILISPMTFEIPESRRDALAVAVSVANYRLADGSFDYDYDGGHIAFRMTSSFTDSLLGGDALAYMLYVSCQTIDAFNDKFLKVAQSDMSIDETVEFIGDKREEK